jgi:hypothetical protein
VDQMGFRSSESKRCHHAGLPYLVNKEARASDKFRVWAVSASGICWRDRI